MERIVSIKQVRDLVVEVRNKRRGFVTNFYLDEFKHGIWINKGVLFYEWINDTLFFIKCSDEFWSVFYNSTDWGELKADLKGFSKHYGDTQLCFDIVGRDTQCETMRMLFEELGYHELTSLVRMTRINEPMEYSADNTICRATKSDLETVNGFLHTFFDEKTEQIPYWEELVEYVTQGHVFVYRDNGKVAGFLIYEINATTLYLRYWFTYPDYRDKKVGSKLLRRFFDEGKETKRQMFWVIRSNENAIKRYRHYGFKEENMFDFVMSNK